MVTRQLYFGDNLDVLRGSIADESVDLIYLDPPFNSKATYNVLFREPTGDAAEAQIEAFDDTWHWNEAAARAFDEVMHAGRPRVFEVLDAFRRFLGTNDMTAYLAMMAVRLIELHRVLKPTGSLYLHCDPTASHYLKILLDAVFGPENYRSEISWRRTHAHNDARQGRKIYGNVRDIIFFYTKSDTWTWNWQYTPYDEHYIDQFYKHVEEKTGRRYRRGDLTAARPGGDTSYLWPVKRPKGGAWRADLEEEYRNPRPGWEYRQHPPYKGRYWAYSFENMVKFEKEGRLVYNKRGFPEYKRYLDEMPGVPLQNAWDDIPPLSPKERLGYPTQKPLALLERIIRASSNEGDVVLDPFCGCGTAVHAAEKLRRQWIGIDVTHLAIALIERRLKDAFPGISFEVIGTPKDLASARDLARRDPYQFQWWAVAQVDAQPYGGRKKGADSGIDGIIYFRGENRTVEKAIVQVKSGARTGVAMIRDLIGVMKRERAQIGVFLTVSLPTRKMEEEAAGAGVYTVHGQTVPRVQILTLAEIFQGKRPRIPLRDPSVGMPRARREVREENGAFDF